jgi:Flp pilus assembly protein TadB
MARGRGGGPQRPVRGFRPGKEPPQLRKQRARQQLPEDANWAQKRLVDVLSERTPQEARRMLRRWRMVMLTVTIVLLVLGSVVYTWSIAAGVVVHVLALAALFLWIRLLRQRKSFETMADQLGGPRRR